MRILVLTQVVPYPPDSGPKIKTYNVVRYLAQRHELHLVSYARSAEEVANLLPLQRFCAGTRAVPLHRSRWLDAVHLARSLLGGRPFLIERDDSPAMRQAVGELLHQHSFDAVHADQLSMAQFAVDLPLALRILDEHNAVWTIVRRAARYQGVGLHRFLAELEWRKLRAYEGKACQRFDVVTVVSHEDYLALAEAARAIFPAEVVPIGVDTQALAYKPRSHASRHVVSVATMFYPPNVEAVYWFARQVFPSIRGRLADVQFYIVGSRPPANITRLAGPSTGIVVTGYLADLEPVLSQSRVWVVPVHSGSGMRVKILEAFARGIPVVSTTVGMEGIVAVPGQHLLVADKPEDFAEAVVQLISQPEQAERLALAGRKLVETSYDWQVALSGLDRAYGSRTQSRMPVNNPGWPRLPLPFRCA